VSRAQATIRPLFRAIDSLTYRDLRSRSLCVPFHFGCGCRLWLGLRSVQRSAYRAAVSNGRCEKTWVRSLVANPRMTGSRLSTHRVMKLSRKLKQLMT
jgi:hypothetical protein